MLRKCAYQASVVADGANEKFFRDFIGALCRCGFALIFLATGVPSLLAGESLNIYPAQISLSGAADYQQVVVVATREDGVTRDVTGEVEWVLDKAEVPVVRLEGSTLYPLADGKSVLRARFAESEAIANIEVAKANFERPVSYLEDVMPIFARAGCNMGSCHGSSRGKDGFRLSLFGFDSAGDYNRLTREMSGRRLNRAVPGDSLLLNKAIGAVPHTGGKLFEKESWYYEALLAWIDQGASNDAKEAAAVTKLDIYPPRAVLEGTGSDETVGSQQFVAVATYADGRTRDVTNLVRFLTNNESSAAVSPSGQVTAGLRGEAFVMARFDTHTVGSQVLVLPAENDYKPSEEEPAGVIDELVAAKLRTLRITPSPLCSDEEFLRRVTLDITGTLPSLPEYQTFLASEASDKRAQKIDRLLQRKEFAELWAMKWAELLMVKSIVNRVEYKPMFLYSQWLTQQIASGVPLDEMVRGLLGASGGSFSSPAVNFYQIEPTTQKTAENVAQIFLGIRIQCAQCHNHAFDRWTMDDYYAFSAFFAQIGRKKGADYRETIVFDKRSGEVKHLVGGRVMKPKFLGSEQPDVQGKDRRKVLAEWITSPENPWFAKSVANRVWAHFFGQGIVEPVDDIRVSNPPSNPDLMEELGRRLVEYQYDFKQLVRDICNSQAYQRSFTANASNATDLRNFSHALARRIPAETLLDSICQVTGVPEKFKGLPLGARAVEIADGKTTNYFLSTFGRTTRDTVCACEVKSEPTLSQALHLLNGTTVHNKIEAGGLVKRLLDEGKKPAEVLDEIYIRCLGRKPNETERERLAPLVGDEPQPVAELEDIFWAVLNSREFVFNH